MIQKPNSGHINQHTCKIFCVYCFLLRLKLLFGNYSNKHGYANITVCSIYSQNEIVLKRNQYKLLCCIIILLKREVGNLLQILDKELLPALLCVSFYQLANVPNNILNTILVVAYCWHMLDIGFKIYTFGVYSRT